jgi:hypothetical protein
MRYIYINTTKNVIREEEIPFIKVQKLILSDTPGKGQAQQKIRQLKRLGWVTLKDGVIEWRKN